MQIDAAWRNAYINRIWDTTSYAMSNSMEYFAEGTAVFFNANRHPNSSGGMNGWVPSDIGTFPAKGRRRSSTIQ